MPKGVKHHPDKAIKACELYAEGFPIHKIAQKLRIKSQTITNWKRKNYPESFEKKRRQRTKDKAQILEEETLENYSKSSIRHQKLLRSAQVRFAKRIAHAEDKEITVNTAKDGLCESIDQEREIFLDVEEVVKIKNRAYASISVGAAAATEGDNAKALAFLNASFDGVYGNSPAKKKD